MNSKSIWLALSMCLLGTVARGDLIIDFKDATLSPGGIGAIDVMISSNTGNDSLGRFSVKFVLTTVDDPNGVLEFRPSAEQSNSERNDPSYVFLGSTDSSGFVSARNGLDKQILTQSDRTGITNDINVLVGTTPLLLARLEIMHTSPVLSNASYQLSLVNDGSALFRLRNNSPTAALDAASFTNIGTVTISAVPEPSSAMLVCVVGMGLACYRRSRHQTSKCRHFQTF